MKSSDTINILDNEDTTMVIYTDSCNVKPKHLVHIKSLVNFTLKKFFSKYLRDRMEIEIVFRTDLLKTENQYGNCTWEDQRHRPRVFTIEIQADQPIKLLLNTIAHELVHVKQWAKGEFAELRGASKDKPMPVYKFNGRKFDAGKLDYWDHPWEIEAHGRAIGLVIQWCKKNNLECKRFVCDG